MANSKGELCGLCCRGTQPIRRNFNVIVECGCGAPFFSQIVAVDNLPPDRQCLIGIPFEFMQEYGDRFDKAVNFEEEDGQVEMVKLGGNVHLGFGFKWREFAQLHNIRIGQVIVLTLVARSRFLVQMYNLGNTPSPMTSANPAQVSATAEVEQACPVPKQVAVKVEDDKDIEVGVAQDWFVAKASRSNIDVMSHLNFASNVKVERILSEALSGQVDRTPERHGGIDVKRQQNCGIIPKMENVFDRVDVADEVEGASVPSKDIKKKMSMADSKDIHKGQCVQPTSPKECPVSTTSAKEDEGQVAPCWSSSESDDSAPSSSSTLDSAWSPKSSISSHGGGRKRSAKKYRTSNHTMTNDEDEDEDLKRFIRKRKRSYDAESSPLDEAKSKRGKISDRNVIVETYIPNGETGTRPRVLVEGTIVKKLGHDWSTPGTRRGRTYVSKRRQITEDEMKETLETAQKVHISHPAFLKQLHKDTCYRALILFPPAQFYRDYMFPGAEGPYKATLIDKEGKTWQTRIRGKRIFWKQFTLDHYLEEYDVVVFELLDSRIKSCKFLVHIFRVVDVKVTFTGKAGWAAHYDVVEGTKKAWMLLRKAQIKKKQRKKKQELKVCSSNPKKDPETTKVCRSKRNMEITNYYNQATSSQGKGKGKQKQKEKHVPDSPNSSMEESEPRIAWKRPTTRIRSQAINQNFSMVSTNLIQRIKQESEVVLPLESVGTLKGIAANNKQFAPGQVIKIGDSD